LKQEGVVMETLDETARAIVADGKGVLAADETAPTIGKRFAARAIESTADSRRAYREMLFSTPGVSQFIGGVILQDETIRQNASSGMPLVELVASQGMIPGIKVDAGAKPMAGSPGEQITEGLDGLRERLMTYRQIGARFAKWRAVIRIGQGLPTGTCVDSNAEALARYAALCQEQDLVPIVEPEVLLDGVHTIERCAEVTEGVLRAVFDRLFAHRVRLEATLLKPSMVIAGSGCARQATVPEVAIATLRTLNRHVPPAIPAIVFLSGGQDHLLATEHLNAINQLEEHSPWILSFSFARALQDEAMETWRGRGENVSAAQRAFYHRARCDSAAVAGLYGSALESEPAPI
jgi:fructose-bisphosphate aldolase class I